MKIRVGKFDVSYVEHGEGSPLLVLHGAGVDHRDPEAAFEPVLRDVAGFRRIYPDLPGMGRTPAPDDLSSGDDVLGLLLDFMTAIAGDRPTVLIGHSLGAYYAREMAARRPRDIAGLALFCPFGPGLRDVPERRVVVGSGDMGDDTFRSYFVVHTAEMLDRYERFVKPATLLVDQSAMERIGQRWALSHAGGAGYAGPTLIVAGRADSTVGSAYAMDLLDDYSNGTLAVIDDAGHALPHEQPGLVGALVEEWMTRVQRAG